jgi:hypothetical protein
MTVDAIPGSDFDQLRPQEAFCNFRIVRCLCSQPIAVGKAEKSAKPQVSISGNSAFSGHDFADALCRDTDFFGQPISTNSHRLEKFFKQELPWRYGFQFSHRDSPLMVIHNLNVLGTSIRPAEAYAELIINSDAVLAVPITLQSFQSVAWRNTEIFQSTCDLQLSKFSTRHNSDTGEPPDPLPFRNGFCVGTLERMDHRPIVTPCVINVKRDYRALL